MWCHLRVLLPLARHPFSSQGQGEQSLEIGGDRPPEPASRGLGAAVFISGCVRAGTEEAWPRISVDQVLRVVPRTDTQGEVFLLPSPSFPGRQAGPRPPGHKETCGGGRAAGDPRPEAMPAAGKAAAETGLSLWPFLPPPLRSPC